MSSTMRNRLRSARSSKILSKTSNTDSPHYDINRRGLDFYNPDVDTNPLITIVGVGGIGSWAALCLTKMGFNSVILCDDDVVESQNIGCQLYGKEDIGKAKVDALMETLEFQGSTKITPQHKKYNALTPKGIMVAAVDNMETRKQIFHSCRHKQVLQFIDCRIGGELILLYVVDPQSEDGTRLYVESLYTDKEAIDLPCTGQNTAYIGMMAGSMIGKEIGRYCKGLEDDFTEIIYDISLGFLKVERK